MMAVMVVMLGGDRGDGGADGGADGGDVRW